MSLKTPWTCKAFKLGFFSKACTNSYLTKEWSILASCGLGYLFFTVGPGPLRITFEYTILLLYANTCFNELFYHSELESREFLFFILISDFPFFFRPDASHVILVYVCDSSYSSPTNNLKLAF